jgi:hypothetical protein
VKRGLRAFSISRGVTVADTDWRFLHRFVTAAERPRDIKCLRASRDSDALIYCESCAVSVGSGMSHA